MRTVAFAKLAHVKLGLMGMTELCRRWGITPTHGYRILARYREEQSVATRPRSGRPDALNAADMRTLERISEEAGGYVTWEGLLKSLTKKQVRMFVLKLYTIVVSYFARRASS
jgi:transposase